VGGTDLERSKRRHGSLRAKKGGTLEETGELCALLKKEIKKRTDQKTVALPGSEKGEVSHEGLFQGWEAEEDADQEPLPEGQQERAWCKSRLRLMRMLR